MHDHVVPINFGQPFLCGLKCSRNAEYDEFVRSHSLRGRRFFYQSLGLLTGYLRL